MKSNQLWKVLIITLVTVTLPISQSYAVVPNAAPILSDVTNVEPQGGFGGHVSYISNDVFHVSTQDLLALISSAGARDEVGIIVDGGTVEETTDISEEEVISTILDGESKPKFWSGKKIVIAGSILLSVTGVVLLIALLVGSGGGSGSGSGSGSGGGAGSNLSSPPGPDNTGTPPGDGTNNGDVPSGDPNDPNSNPNDPGNTPPANDGNPFVPPGGGAGPGPGGNGNPFDLPGGNPGGGLPGGDIPVNPEPSTLLLMGLGLLVPFFRKRSS